MISKLNAEQINAFKSITDTILSGRPGFFLCLGMEVLAKLSFGVLWLLGCAPNEK
jgi:hypothetical protein